jgi:hypothetical protein
MKEKRKKYFKDNQIFYGNEYRSANKFIQRNRDLIVAFCRLYYQIKSHYKNEYNIKKLDDYDKMLKLIRPDSTLDKYWQKKSLEEHQAIKTAYLNNFPHLNKDKEMEEVGANKYFLLEGLHPAFSEFAIDMLMPPVQSDGLENKLNT